MFKQLLVPIDGSELATHAITQGLALARQLGASVTGFVVEAMPALPGMGTHLANYQREVKAHEAQTEAHAKKLLAAFEWNTGTFLFFKDKECVNQSAPLGLDAYEILGAGASRIPIAYVRDQLSRHAQSRLKSSALPPVPPEVFRLGGKPRQAYDRLTGQQMLSEVLALFDDAPQQEDFERMVFLLIEAEMVS